MDFDNFTPVSSTLGGILVGLAAASILFSQGRVAGVSGICGSLLQPARGDFGWRLAFTLGLLGTGAVAAAHYPSSVAVAGLPGLPTVAIAGVLVGFGTRLGNGCTSGHGVCGVSRLSKRSIVATVTFILVAAATVFVVRHTAGGGA